MHIYYISLVVVVGSFLLLSLAPAVSDWGISSATTTNNSSSFTLTNGATTITNNNHNLHTQSPDAVLTPAAPLTPVWWLATPTSFGQSILFLLSAIYFTLDGIALYIRGRLVSSRGQRILTHHILSIIGLIGPIVSGLDGPLVLLGFVLAECSNPPFHVLTLCKYAVTDRSAMRLTCRRSWMRYLAKPILSICLSMDLSLVHILIFVLSRLACLQFTAHAVMPFAELLTTKVTSIMLCLLSAAQFVDLCKTLQLGDSSSSSYASGSGGGSKRSIGWKQVMAEMRELQQECDSTAVMSDDFSYHAAHHSTRRKFSASSYSSSSSGDESDSCQSRHAYHRHGSSSRSRFNSSGSGSASASAACSTTNSPTRPHSEANTSNGSRREKMKKRLF